MQHLQQLVTKDMLNTNRENTVSTLSSAKPSSEKTRYSSSMPLIYFNDDVICSPPIVDLLGAFDIVSI